MPDNSKLPILIAGCAGFIGARTAELLLSKGRTVIGIDNLNEYYDVRLKQFRLEKLLAHPSFLFERLDLENRDGLKQLFDKFPFDAVINLAACAGVRSSLENPHAYMSTNVTGSLNLLEAMRLRNTRKYILPSTSSLYAGQQMPFVETTAVNTPLTPYAASKRAAESMAHSYHHLYGIDVSVIRYFTVYGPAGRPDMCIFRFIRWIEEAQPIQIFGDGSQARDFVFVDDIARGTVLALQPLGYEVINMGGGRTPVSLMNLISRLEKIIGKSAKVEFLAEHPADMKTTSANIVKAKNLLGWQPEVSIDEGLRKTVEWYRNNSHVAAMIEI